MPGTGPAAGAVLAFSLILILAGVATMLAAMLAARAYRPADMTPRRDRHASTE